MSKVILITGPQGSGKNILADFMAYDHEQVNFDDLKRKQQLGVAKALKGLDKIVIDQCYPDVHLLRIIDICRNMEVDAIFISNEHLSRFPENLFDIEYNVTARFSNVPLIPPRETYMSNDLTKDGSRVMTATPEPPSPPEPREQEHENAPSEFWKDQQNKGE
jgi:hypothetical protein